MVYLPEVYMMVDISIWGLMKVDLYGWFKLHVMINTHIFIHKHIYIHIPTMYHVLSTWGTDDE